MRRSDAGKLLKHNRYLTISERVVFLLLLEGADNLTCDLPAKMAPNSRVELAQWAGLSSRQVQRVFKHLEGHGWVGLARGNGRGQRTRYVLVPRTPDPDCPTGCELKGDTVSPIRSISKGDTVSGKGRHHVRERETSGSPLQQVKPAIGTREQGSGVVAPPRCDLCSATPIRTDGVGARYCEACAPHLFKESA